MGIKPLKYPSYLTSNRFTEDFGFESGLNRCGMLVCLSDNLCLQGEGIEYLEFTEFHSVLGFGNYNKVQVKKNRYSRVCERGDCQRFLSPKVGYP